MIDAITLEVLRNRFETIAQEMQVTLLRSSVSVILKEGEDCSCGLFTAAGDTIAQACALPIHLGVMTPAVRAILDTFPPETMADGDVYIVNDPYAGGTHLPDVIIAAPVFSGGRLVAFSVALAHQEDMGGKVPGSMPADSTEIFQEGLIIPPSKLYDHGAPNETLRSLIRRNVRLPDIVLGDLDAELAAVKIGARGFHATVEEYGETAVADAVEELFRQSELLTRQKIVEIPDGSYRFQDFLDNDGLDLDRRIQLAVTLTIRGSDVLVDFEGTAPQCRGPLNIGYWGTVAAVYYVVRAVTGADIPTNAGCTRPIEVRVPEGTILNPVYPAPVCIRAHTAKRVADVVLGAFARAVPGRVSAASNGAISVCSFGGRDPATGRRFGCTDIVAGGMGGRSGKDGIDLIETDTSNCMNIPVEAFEAHFPLRVLRTRYRQDSGGAGEFRGGLGVERVLEATAGPIQCSFRSERHFTPAWGLLGGGPGQTWATHIRRASGEQEIIPSKRVFTLDRGDALVMLTGGGGGYGDPLERAPRQVVEDVLDGKVSVEAARDCYGVVVGDGEGKADLAATEERRRQMHAARGPVTWTFDRGGGQHE
jgi:N-methylhydantoinase B/oxoprolinase/acetone carboxylase alpha subunit